MGDKDIKSKPQSVRAMDNAPKTAPKIKDKVIRGAEVLKDAELKSRIKTKEHTAEQNESPERYATDTVEQKASEAVYITGHSAEAAVRHTSQKIRQKIKTRNMEYESDTPTEEQSIQSDQPKTKDAVTRRSEPDTRHKTPERQDQPAIKTREAADSRLPEGTKDKNIHTRQKAAIKSREAVTATKEPQGESVRIKTKDEYIRSKTDGKRAWRLKTDKVYHAKPQNIQPKLKQIAQEKQKPDIPDSRQQAAKRYVQNKLRTRAEHERVEAERAATSDRPMIKTKEAYLHTEETNYPANKPTNIQQIKGSDTPVELNTAQHSDLIHQKPKPTGDEQLKLKRTEVKTKDSYIARHTRTIATKESQPPLQSKAADSAKPRIKQRTGTAKNTLKTRKTAKPASKGTRTIKTSRNAAKRVQKKVVKTQKQAAKKAAKQAVKRARELTQRTAQATKAAVKTAIHAAKVAIQAAITAARAMISAIAAGGAVAVVLVALIVVIIIAAIIASPFGIFISDEVTEPGTIPLSQIIAEYNVELTQQTEDIELSVDHTSVEVVDNRTDNNIVLAVFAAKTAGAEDDTATDVVIFDAEKAEKLKEYFRAANTVDYMVFEVVDEDGETIQRDLTITITGKTKEQLMDYYSLTPKQREAVETLLEESDVMTGASHSLAVTDANVQAILKGLPESLPQKRKDVVKNAASLVGKVNYFWGGKSTAMGWDPAWGTMRRVTAAGSPSSGTIRAFGLDCSGFVTWAFNNSGMGFAVGHGTMGQKAVSTQVTASTVQAGDLAFLPSYSHVGIVVGKNTSGNILVIHCSSSANNVVLSTASSVGFTIFRRPHCY
ncbi:MAG: C40 family peptidase [Clostridia bacterium]|nr:C40 family peptidase [Clostridia bacterium]